MEKRRPIFGEGTLLCLIATLVCAWVMGGSGRAGALPPDFVNELIAGGLQTPTDVAIAPDGRLFIAEKRGMVWIHDGSALLPTPFIDLVDEVNNAHDRGLLGVTLDPNFAQNGYVYFLYTVDPIFGQPDESSESITYGRLTRYTASGDVANLSSRLILLGRTAADGFPSAYKSHTIGTVEFGLDGSLFVSAGDGAHYDFIDGGQDVTSFDPEVDNIFGAAEDIGALRSQRLESLAGKVVRINPANGEAMPDNPFHDGDPTSNRSRVWSYGLRNPFRLTVRPNTPGPGTLYISDVGLSRWEEVNVAAQGGVNFGWPCYEGVGEQPDYQSHALTGVDCSQLTAAQVTRSLMDWSHSAAWSIGFIGKSAAGLAFYDETQFPQNYWGALFFSDYADSWIRVAYVGPNNELLSIDDFATNLRRPVDLEIHPQTGDLIYISIRDNEVRRIRYTLSNSAPVVQLAAVPNAGHVPLDVIFSSNGTFDPDGDPFSLEWNFGDGTPVSSLANPTHTYTVAGRYTATLTAIDDQGRGASRSIVIDALNDPPTVAVTNPVDGYLFDHGEVVQFTAAANDIEDGSNLAYHWEIQLVHNAHEHPEVVVSDLREPPPFTLESHGALGDRFSYKAIVTVTDSGGLTATDSISLVPRELPVNNPPIATFLADPVMGGAPLFVAFDATASVDPDGDLLTYDWDFGDGATSINELTTHIYAAAGDFSVILTVTDSIGASAQASALISVSGSVAAGLTAEYFNDRNLTAPALTRTDATVDFDWARGAPDPTMAPETFSVRWTGFVTAQSSETFTFFTQSDDGVRLWIDGALVIDQWVDQAETEWSSAVALSAGASTPITMEFYENRGDAVARLLWSSPSVPKQVAPAGALTHAASVPTAETPTISPPGGTFTDPVAVIISTTTPGAEIRITSDGSAPTSSSSLYTGSFSIDINTLLQARAFAPGLVASTVASAAFQFELPPGQDLMAQWSFEEGSGATALDGSGNGNHAAITGGSWAAGRVGGGMDLDGAGAHLAIVDDPSLSLSNHQITIAMWVMPRPSNAGWATLIHKSNAAGSWLDWQIYSRARDAGTRGRPVFRINFDGDRRNDSDESVEAGRELTPGIWQHLAATYDGVELRFYLDGVLSGSTPKLAGNIPSSTREIWLGGNDIWGEYFDGLIDETKLFNRALDAGEIAALASGGAPVNGPPFALDDSLATDEDAPLAVLLMAGDPDGDALQFQITAQPQLGALSGVAPALVYTPDADAHGADSFSFQVSDGRGGVAGALVGISIRPVNDSPVADDLTVVTSEGQSVAVTLSGSDVDGDALGFSVTAGPSNGQLSGTPPDLTYSPAANFRGADAFTFEASDPAGATDTGTVAITVTPIQSALAGHWTMDEGQGSIANDASGHGNTGAISGASWTVGKIGAGLDFDGSSARVAIADDPSLDFASGQMTIAMWIKPRSLSSRWSTLTQKSNAAGNWLDWQIYARASDAPTRNRPVFRINFDGDRRNDAGEQVQAGAELAIGTWQHIACTYDGQTLKFYIDGAVSGSAPAGGGAVPDGGRDIWLGGNDIWGEWFDGSIDETRIYRRALGAAEIQALAAQTAP